MKRFWRSGEMHSTEELFSQKSNTILDLCGKLNALEALWRNIVGEALYIRSRPIQLQYDESGKGVLLVVVNSGAALQNMNFKKISLLQAINRAIPLSIDRIDIRIGRLPAAKGSSDFLSRKKRVIPINENRVKEIEEQLSLMGIQNKGLLNALARYRFLCEHKRPNS